MREELLLTVTPAPIRNLAELYAVAFHQAQSAARHYRDPAGPAGETAQSLRPVFNILAAREDDRAQAHKAVYMEACGREPHPTQLPASFVDLVPAQEVTDLASSGLATPYAAWALAVRHRQRAFMYWTYIAALARDPAVRNAAEQLAREALFDGNALRRERRLAWQSEHKRAPGQERGDRDASAALLESLLQKDVMAWSQTLPPAERIRLLQAGTLETGALPDHEAAGIADIPPPSPDELESVKERALRRAEQLSNVYLDAADSADDQGSLELAQKLAANSIARLAGLRAAAKAQIKS